MTEREDSSPRTTAMRLLGFLRRILSDFFLVNNGLLLSGAVAYNALLSLVPLCAVFLVVLSKFFDEQRLLATLTAELALITSGDVGELRSALEAFIEERHLIGWIGFLVLLFFSSIAFRILENAMRVIFEKGEAKVRRSFWISALIHYLFVGLLGFGVVLATILTSAIDAFPAEKYRLLGSEIPLDRVSNIILYLCGLGGLLLLFSALYKILPVISISFRRALIGGAAATALWELVRHALVAYFTHISFLNVVYGSMAAVVIVLLSMEAAAVIILIGAQIIAELERNEQLGLPWYADSPARAFAKKNARSSTLSHLKKRPPPSSTMTNPK